MANSFESNFTRMLARVFLEKFESARVLSKNVDTQLLAGKFAPNTGDTVDFKRPTDYVSRRTATGDVSSGALKSDIITGKASGVVQDYFTVFVDYDEADEAIKMDQLDQLLAPMATRIVTDMELDFAAFMLKNTSLVTGTVGSPILTWDDVAAAGALMAAAGVPADSMWNYALNPFTQRTLASDQRSLGAGGVAGGLIDSAHKRAIITDNFAGMKVMMATTLSSFTTPATGDTTGAMNGAPDVTYLTAKDTMTQVLAVTGFGAFSGVIPAGTVLEITGVNRLNLNTRQPIIDELGANVIWRCVVQTDATLAGGAGNITVTGPGIFTTGGQYNTTDVAIGAANVVTILNADSTLFQPNVFWHRQAFGIGSVPIKKLHSTDTLATTEDGMQMRVSKGVGFLENNQKVRFDFRPAYAAFNPFFAGQGWGTP
jgi:hypothetical protein